MKYRLSQIAAVVGGRFSGTDCEVQSVVTDSRSLTCAPGDRPPDTARPQWRFQQPRNRTPAGEGDEQLALIEAGISKPGEMARLERIIRPDVVVFTSIGDAHQENFLNLEQKCDEKMVLAHRAETIPASISASCSSPSIISTDSGTPSCEL